MRAISVEELVNSRKISRKTYNILVRARMRNVFDLVRYKSGLPRLFRTGTASVKEINSLLEEVEGAGRISEFSSFLFPPEPEESKGEQLIDTLTEEQMEYLEEVYRQQWEHLATAKEKTAVKMGKLLAGIPARVFLRDYLLEDNDRFRMLGNMREASLLFLEQVKKRINEAIEGLADNDIPLQYKILMLHADGLLDNDDFILDFYKSHGCLPMLHLVQKTIIDKKETPLFKAFLQRYDIFGGKVEVDMTPIEKSTFTITSYSNSIFDALFTKEDSAEPLGNFITQLLADNANLAYLEEMLQDDFVCVDNECINIIISDEHLLMQPLCVVALLGKWMQKDFTCLGGYTRNLGSAMEGRWSHGYLVRKSILGEVDLENELWHFKDAVVKVCTEEHAVDMEDYVKERMGGQMALAPVIKRIVVDELALPLDEQGMVVVPKKKEKALVDRLFILLDNNKEPMTLDQLTDAINSSGSRRYVRASISLALNKDKRFQGSGKKGCYALSEWQLPYFGSNADIVFQVLDEANRPMKTEEIVAFLTKYSYNKQFSKGDLASVFLLGKEKFIKLGPMLYGLVGRTYPNHETTGEEGNDKTENQEHQLPSGTSEPSAHSDTSESPDHSGCSSATVSSYPSQETVSQSTPLEGHSSSAPSITSQAVASEPSPLMEKTSPSIPPASSEPTVLEEPPAFEKDQPSVEAGTVTVEKPGDDVEWPWMCAIVLDFVCRNNREPLAMFTAEVELAYWLATQKRAMREGSLSETQKESLMEIRDKLW